MPVLVDGIDLLHSFLLLSILSSKVFSRSPRTVFRIPLRCMHFTPLRVTVRQITSLSYAVFFFLHFSFKTRAQGGNIWPVGQIHPAEPVGLADEAGRLCLYLCWAVKRYARAQQPEAVPTLLLLPAELSQGWAASNCAYAETRRGYGGRGKVEAAAVWT